LGDTEDDAAFDAIRKNDEVLLPGVRAILSRHAIPRSVSIVRFAEGSLPVYAVGEERVLKLFPPAELRSFETECAGLELVSGRLPIPTPRVEAAGCLDDWPYILMSRLSGQTLAKCWSRIPPDERLGLAESLGAAMATMHRIAVSEDSLLRIDWEAFVANQRDNAVDRQRKLGLDEGWLTQIPDFLGRFDIDSQPGAALLHTELMREHLLVVEDRGRFRLSGLFDFEPAMVGDPGYELASLGLFVSCGDASFLGRYLDAYGLDLAQRKDLSRSCLRWALLHRYSNLPWYLSRLPAGTRITTLPELAEAWWGTTWRGPS
jgi:hygromycin-B 7''-O-kinase